MPLQDLLRHLGTGPPSSLGILPLSPSDVCVPLGGALTDTSLHIYSYIYIVIYKGYIINEMNDNNHKHSIHLLI